MYKIKNELLFNIEQQIYTKLYWFQTVSCTKLWFHGWMQSVKVSLFISYN